MSRRRSRTERRRAIVDAAREVFSSRGYAQTRMADVAQAAQVGKGTLYEYFRSKEELFTTLIVTVIRESLETVGSDARKLPPGDSLRRVIQSVVQIALVENLDLYRLFFDFWGVSMAAQIEARQSILKPFAAFLELVGDIVRRGQREGTFRAEVDPELVARILVAAIDGLSLQIVMLGQPVDLKAYVSTLQDMIVGRLEAGGRLDGASLMKDPS